MKQVNKFMHACINVNLYDTIQKQLDYGYHAVAMSSWRGLYPADFGGRGVSSTASTTGLSSWPVSVSVSVGAGEGLCAWPTMGWMEERDNDAAFQGGELVGGLELKSMTYIIELTFSTSYEHLVQGLYTWVNNGRSWFVYQG